MGSPVQSHPELVSGSGFDPLGGAGRSLTDNVVFSSVHPLFPREAGIATWAVLAQPCVQCSTTVSLLNGVGSASAEGFLRTKSKALSSRMKIYLIAKKAGLTECKKWSHERTKEAIYRKYIGILSEMGTNFPKGYRFF
ncbi:hypothetical protein BG32_01670 [Mesotoga sp. HF07.pep.5.2.highcov]|uniref:Uncharacterized protein n=1 Tax=Mesotoga prima MesG1.Ag.4.2 TaxID=660470 RepID=I2F5X0_9BACT|nr:hypothetical protein Theba_1660 [Mesotoga prima MesG1.Ag.4.2]AFK07394.1 hypothetical protein Theba_1737 [Mesotoga prima MesG1.Ag.4.2]RLL91691.1 hypothetical protein BG32_01670 [Mesotoga sp. HF07.pep.5.2.highcov]